MRPERDANILLFGIVVILLLAATFVYAQVSDPTAPDSEPSYDLSDPESRQMLLDAAEQDISVLNNDPELMNDLFAHYGIENQGASLESYAGGVITTSGTDSTSFRMDSHPGAKITSSGKLILKNKAEISGGAVSMEGQTLVVLGGAVDASAVEDRSRINSIGGEIKIGSLTYRSDSPIYVNLRIPPMISGSDVTISRGGSIIAGFTGPVSQLSSNSFLFGSQTKFDVYENNIKSRQYAVKQTTIINLNPKKPSCQTSEYACIDEYSDSIVVNSKGYVFMDFFDEQGNRIGDVHFMPLVGILHEGDITQLGKNLGFFMSSSTKEVITKEGFLLVCEEGEEFCSSYGTITRKPDMRTDRKANPANYYSSKNEKEYIIIHDTTNTGTSALNTFENPSSRASAQFVVMEDGTIYQMMDPEQDAMSVGTTYHDADNRNSISIEVAGGHDQPRTPEQIKALSDLVMWLSGEYGIPPENILTHEDITTRPSDQKSRKPNDGVLVYTEVESTIKRSPPPEDNVPDPTLAAAPSEPGSEEVSADIILSDTGIIKPGTAG